MGFMTEVSILNDMWDQINRNPTEFVNQVYASSMSGTSEVYGPYVIGQTTVAKTHHADDIRVYFSGRNSFYDAYPGKNMDIRRLKYHLESLKEMKRYIKLSEDATKAAIAKGENVETK